MSPGRIATLTGAVVVLIAALLLQTVRIRNVKLGDVTSPPQPIGLGEKVPRQLAGWTARDEPLGPSEFVQSAVEKTLNYDDVVNRVYSTGGGTLGVYIAYWSPGRMPMEKVASHTPDRCWSENGWRCTAMRYPEIVTTAAGTLRPAYWRVFVPPASGRAQHVMYWHLVGGELYDYGGGFNRRPGIVKWWRDMLHYAFKGSAEQYFVRLTSDRPFETLRGDVGFEAMLTALAQFGLSEES